MLLALLTMTMPDRNSDHDALLARAEAAVREAIPIAEADPLRPSYHFRPPARWMNDPNGTIYHDGWYHVFYQFNPYGDEWGNMHWGHARSRDLVKWEHLPIALPPSKAAGEEHVYSGSTFVAPDGTPTIFYTSIGSRAPEQWIARPLDRELIRWTKPASNPALTVADNAPGTIDEWRDPFPISYGGRTYLLTGGRQDGHGVVMLHRAKDATLTRWEPVGVLFRHPDADLIECPNLARVGSRWVLLVSAHGRVEARTGTFTPKAGGFGAERTSVLQDGSYASQLLRDARGRVIHLAWVRMPGGIKGWNGCLTLPNVLTVGRDGDLRARPVEALTELRQKTETLRDRTLDAEETLKVGSGDRVEIELEVDPGSAHTVTLHLRAGANGEHGTKIVYDALARTLRLHDRHPAGLAERTLRLHVFIDGGLIEMYADGGRLVMSHYLAAAPDEKGIRLTAEGGSAQIRTLKLHTLRPATFTPSRL